MISALPVVPAVPKLIVCPSRNIHAVAVDPVDTTPIEPADVAPGECVPTETSELFVSLSCSTSIEPMVTNSLEVTTVQLEFAALANHTGRPALRRKSDAVFELLDQKGPRDDGSGRLWPIHSRPESGATSGSQISWGAMGDSFYEYLLKYWLLTGKRHEQYKRMYLQAVRGMIAKLLINDDGLWFVAESKNGRIDRKMDHLVCFVPGMLALGAQHIPEVRATLPARAPPRAVALRVSR